jgi:hypothetical protein
MSDREQVLYYPDEYSNRSDRVIINTASGAFPLVH